MPTPAEQFETAPAVVCDLLPCRAPATARLTYGSDGQPATSCNICKPCLDEFNAKFRGQIQQNMIWITLAPLTK